MAKQARELLGRDAIHAKEQGPTYFKEGTQLVEEFSPRLREAKDPATVVQQLKEKNFRLAKDAQAQADAGDWDLFARQMNRKRLIESICQAFNLELGDPVLVGVGADEAGEE